MTELRLKLVQPLADGQLEVGAVAELRQLLDEKGQMVRPMWQQTRPVAVWGSGSPSNEDGTEFTRFDLPSGGRFGITIRLPRGDDIEQEIDIASGETRPETIDLPFSPHEYLGWQQFSGVVRNAPNRREQLVTEPGLLKLDQLVSITALNSARHYEADLFERRGNIPAVFSAQPPEGGEAWQLLSGPVSEGPPPQITNWQQPIYDDDYCLWIPTMPNEEDSRALVQALRGEPVPDGVRERFPRWMILDREGHRDLVSVPWGWWGLLYPRRSEGVRLLYDRANASPIDREQPGRTVVSLQDQRWGGLLEYVASGRLEEAGDLAPGVLDREHLGDVFDEETPEAALHGKTKGPLSAVLGGLVLVSTTRESGQQHWDRWLVNLANWFPALPDGAILLGYRLLRLGQYDEGRERLIEGLNRGIPYFAFTFRMLTLGFSQLEDDAALKHISHLATRVDPSQPFTVIRLPEGN